MHHLKQAIRLIADTPGVEKLHLLAHSRRTDVLVTALRELEIEAYIGGRFLDGRFKVRNIVLMSPDLDLGGGEALQHRARPCPSVRRRIRVWSSLPRSCG